MSLTFLSKLHENLLKKFQILVFSMQRVIYKARESVRIELTQLLRIA